MEAERTLRRYYVYAGLSGLQFGWTTWLFFVISRGGNPGWAESAFHLAIFLGEVPTGIVADMIGRRTSMILGLTIGAIASFGYLGISGTATACLVLGLSGFGSTFMSGADRALLYETAFEIGGADLARRAMAKAAALQMVFLATAPIIAGLLYQWRDWSPFISRGILSLVGVVIVWGMVDRHSESFATEARPKIWSHLVAAVRIVRDNRLVLGIMLFSWSYNAIGSLVGQFAQAYLPGTGLTMVAAGIVFSIARVMTAGGGKLVERMSERAALWSLRFAPFVQSLCYFAMGFGGRWVASAGFILGDSLDGLITPSLEYQLNKAVPSEQRATILSLNSAGGSMIMTIIFPAFSYLQPMSLIYLVTGGLGMVVGVLWAIRRF